MRKSLFLCAVALLLSLTLLSRGTASAAEITVSAAASLTNAFTELAKQFEASKPGLIVRTNFAASNPLLRQIEAGAPVDVFASADQETIDKAQQGGFLLPGSRVDFTANTLVLIVPAGAKVRPSTLKGLRHNDVQSIAIGNPDSVPAGRYAREVLMQAAEWEALSKKYVMGQSVRQVLDYVARGEVTAGMVYGSDAVAAGDKVQVMAVLQGHKPILYPMSVLKQSKEAQLAKDFVAFVRGPQGLEVLKKYGFTALPEVKK